MTAQGHRLFRGAVVGFTCLCLCLASAAEPQSVRCNLPKAQLEKLTPEQLPKGCDIVDNDSGEKKEQEPTQDDLRRERAFSLEQLQAPHFRPVVAKPTGYRAKAKPISVNQLYLGDGWGCARLHDEATYCWQVPAPGTHTGPVKAEHIAWLDDQHMGVGSDRICTRELRNEYRCWRAPEFMALPHTWRKPDLKSVAQNLTWGITNENGDSLVDRQPVTHGAWHGCSGGWCWNPLEPQSVVKLCRAGSTVVPCSGVNEATLREFDERPNVGDHIVGDLFACRRWNDKLECLGASRDGFFGSAAECPRELFTSWPTIAGPVVAPNAKCARKPVRVGKGRFLGNDASASPRGICIGSEDVSGAAGIDYQCFGAVTPIQPGLTSIQLGLGDEPSACALDPAGNVLCWGHGYTESAKGNKSVSIEFDIPKSGPIVAWQGSGKFHAGCQIERNCTRSAAPLPVCAPGLASLSLSNVFKRMEELKDNPVSVAGTLGISGVVSDQVGMQCGPYESDGITPDIKRGGGFGNDYCCQEAHGPIVVTASNGFLPLEGVMCSGDRSRLCCNVAVLGQKVIVTGTLVWRDYVAMLGPSWALSNPEICEIHP